MLVLSRKIGEQIVIGNDIRVTIVDIKHGKVSLGVSAPLEVPIHREEVAMRIEESQRELEVAMRIKQSQRELEFAGSV